ncbi:MAG TPA: UvrD-helicase domain-containing protein, partial [Bacteroidota bacterium]|nr:UvrD-helicase domain-containing protein [Bacteroidota bacterium]
MQPLNINTLPLTTIVCNDSSVGPTETRVIGGTVCIEASAGTGKTYAIGLLALRLVMEDPGISLARLAVVTFTDAATGELSERIAEFLRLARDYAAASANHAIGASGVDRTRLSVGAFHADDAPSSSRAQQGASTAGARHTDNEEIRMLVETAISQSDKKTVLRRLDDALLNIDLARISTIHGFCSRILNEFAFETRSSFGMELIKNQDEVIHQILSDFWRREIAPLEPRLFQFVECLTPESLY